MLKKLTAAGIVAAAITGAVLTASPANADTDGTGGTLSGNRIVVPISIPVDLCGNAIAVLGHSVGVCHGGVVIDSRHHGYHGES